MKKLFYLLLFFTISNFAQQSNETTLSSNLNGTTLEEYNYLSKGYKDQIDKGLDMKKGYILKNVISDFSDAISFSPEQTYKRHSEFKLLFKEGDSKPCAILMILTVYHKSKLNATHYFCIPTYNSNLWTNLKEDLYKVYIEKYEISTKLNRVDLFQHYLNSLKMISYALTTENIK